MLTTKQLILQHCSPISAELVVHKTKLEMWANAQCDGRPAKYRWRAPFNAAKFG